MKINYELRFVDYLTFNIAHQFNSITVQIFFVGVSLFSLWGSIESLYMQSFMAVFIYVLMWIIQLVFTTCYLFFGKNRSLLTKYEIEIQAADFLVETSYSKCHYFWSGISKVISRLGIVAVYTNSHAAHIIPRRAFSDVDERSMFISKINNKLNKNLT